MAIATWSMMAGAYCVLKIFCELFCLLGLITQFCGRLNNLVRSKMLIKIPTFAKFFLSAHIVQSLLNSCFSVSIRASINKINIVEDTLSDCSLRLTHHLSSQTRHQALDYTVAIAKNKNTLD